MSYVRRKHFYVSPPRRFLSPCAKDDVAPVDVEKQAFEDLRAEIVEVITDPVREAEAIRLVGVLEEDLATLRTNIAARKTHVSANSMPTTTRRGQISRPILRASKQKCGTTSNVSPKHTGHYLPA